MFIILRVTKYKKGLVEGMRPSINSKAIVILVSLITEIYRGQWVVPKMT